MGECLLDGRNDRRYRNGYLYHLRGLRAVVYTDMMQMFVLVGGSVAATFYGLEALGGWEGMMTVFHDADQSLGYVSESLLQSLAAHVRPDFPWTGILFGAPILGSGIGVPDQFIVQRVLRQKDISNAGKGTLFGGFLKILPLFIFVIPGVIAFCSFPERAAFFGRRPRQGVACHDHRFSSSRAQRAHPGGMLAALMSFSPPVFNSCSTLFTIDFYKSGG